MLSINGVLRRVIEIYSFSSNVQPSWDSGLRSWDNSVRGDSIFCLGGLMGGTGNGGGVGRGSVGWNWDGKFLGSLTIWKKQFLKL